jgi:hypothetical protein
MKRFDNIATVAAAIAAVKAEVLVTAVVPVAADWDTNETNWAN